MQRPPDVSLPPHRHGMAQLHLYQATKDSDLEEITQAKNLESLDFMSEQVATPVYAVQNCRSGTLFPCPATCMHVPSLTVTKMVRLLCSTTTRQFPQIPATFSYLIDEKWMLFPRAKPKQGGHVVVPVGVTRRATTEAESFTPHPVLIVSHALVEAKIGSRSYIIITRLMDYCGPW